MRIVFRQPPAIIKVLLIAVLLLIPTTAVSAESLAVSTIAPVIIDGQEISFDSYNIEGSNYFKLRDLAYALTGSEKSFEISFDNELKAIMLTMGQAYTPVGGEMTLNNSGDTTPLPNAAKVFLNGQQILPTAYNIGGNTYFKLRDIAQAIDFCVEWDAEKSAIIIDTNRNYGQEDAVPLANLPTSLEILKGQKIGDAPNEAVLGKPRRIINDSTGTQICIYGDYSFFALLCVNNGKIAYIYTNHAYYRQQAAKVYTDNNDGGKVYAMSSGAVPALSDKTTEQIIFEVTNAFRGFNGLEALRWSDTLSKAALEHSLDMSGRNFFSHENPDGLTPDERLTKAGYDWRACAENIIAGYQNGFDAVDVLINSAGHRKNLLTSSCNELGVGWIKAEKGKYSYYGTQLFGRT